MNVMQEQKTEQRSKGKKKKKKLESAEGGHTKIPGFQQEGKKINK